MPTTNAGYGIFLWPKVVSVNSSKPETSPLLAELFGSIPLMTYNCRQAIKADALNTLRILTTANYCANNHLFRIVLETKYKCNNWTPYIWRVISDKIKPKIFGRNFFLGRVNFTPQTFLRVNFTPQILYFTTQMFEG